MKLVLENGWLWVVEGVKGGCWVSEEMVKSELLTGLRMFFPQGCLKER